MPAKLPVLLLLFALGLSADAGGYGHRNTGIQLNKALVTFYGSPGSIFERTLVHEIDHLLGYLGHTDAAGVETVHTAQCG